MNLDAQVALNLSVAALAGLAVGIERQWSGHAVGPDARFAGARTFLLLGIMGGVAGWLIDGGLQALGIVVVGSGAALTIAAYVLAARTAKSGIEGTTEVAALAVLALGTIAGLGFPLLTSAAVSLIVLALAEKTRIHDFIARIGERELMSALRFAVLAVVILPILPEGPYGPFDSIRPRSLWVMVLLFSGMNFAGHLARKAVGTSHGYGITGIIGGLVSSTLVTLNFSRLSRGTAISGPALALGVIGASTMLIPRVLIVTTILHPAVALLLLTYLGPPLLIGLGWLILAFARSRREKGTPEDETKTPLGLWSAIKMAAAFQVVLFLIPVLRDAWGTTAVLTSAAILGLTDMDALTVSMARLGQAESAALAANAIAVGVLSNAGLKLTVVVVLGTGTYRWLAAAGLVALATGSVAGLWLGAR